MPPLHTRRQPDLFRRRSHVAGGALDHVLRRDAVALDLRRLEALRDLVAMQPRQPALVLHLPADVAGEVAGSEPRLPERARADRQPVEQLDMHEPVAPGSARSAARGTNRPTAKCACRPCPPGCHCGTHTYGNRPASSPARSSRKNPARSRAQPRPGRGSPRRGRSACRAGSAGSRPRSGGSSPAPAAPASSAARSDIRRPPAAAPAAATDRQPPPSPASG